MHSISSTALPAQSSAALLLLLLDELLEGEGPWGLSGGGHRLPATCQGPPALPVPAPFLPLKKLAVH